MYPANTKASVHTTAQAMPTAPKRGANSRLKQMFSTPPMTVKRVRLASRNLGSSQ